MCFCGELCKCELIIPIMQTFFSTLAVNKLRIYIFFIDVHRAIKTYEWNKLVEKSNAIGDIYRTYLVLKKIAVRLHGNESSTFIRVSYPFLSHSVCIVIYTVFTYDVTYYLSNCIVQLQRGCKYFEHGSRFRDRKRPLFASKEAIYT